MDAASASATLEKERGRHEHFEHASVVVAGLEAESHVAGPPQGRGELTLEGG
jgi:hypothetical protein